ncbi:hypothetical protein FJZ26_06160, partial [Candidatus Parvarchaeota archaeon]|nr:hypothetical protein [Candidatus Parvarchaeota archaeon]
MAAKKAKHGAGAKHRAEAKHGRAKHKPEKSRSKMKKPLLCRTRNSSKAKPSLKSKKPSRHQAKQAKKKNTSKRTGRLFNNLQLGRRIRSKPALSNKPQSIENHFWKINSLISAEVSKIERHGQAPDNTVQAATNQQDEGRLPQRPTVSVRYLVNSKIGSELKGLEDKIRDGFISP